MKAATPLPSSASQDTAIVTKIATDASPFCKGDWSYIVRYVVQGVEHGGCTFPDSLCASEARVGRPLPQSCGGS